MWRVVKTERTTMLSKFIHRVESLSSLYFLVRLNGFRMAGFLKGMNFSSRRDIRVAYS